MSKKFILNLLAIIVPAIILIILLYIILFDFIIYNSYSVFPNQRYRYKISFYSDLFWGGKSYVKNDVITGNNISYKYHLKEWDDYSIAGMSIDLTDQDKGLDLSKYKFINIKMISSEKSEYRLFLLTNIDNKSKKSNPSTLRHHRENIIIDKKNQIQSIKLNLNKFQIPEWWILASDYEGEKNFKKFSQNVILLQLQNNDFTVNKDFKVTINEIRFTKGFPYIYSILSIIILLYLTVYLIFTFYFKKILMNKGVLKEQSNRVLMPNLSSRLKIYSKQSKS